MSDLVPTMFMVEVRYAYPDNIRQVIAKFDLHVEAERYVARHQNDGGGHLRIVVVNDYRHLEWLVGNNVSFTWYTEAVAYAQRFGLSVNTVDGGSRATVSHAVGMTDRDNTAPQLAQDSK